MTHPDDLDPCLHDGVYVFATVAPGTSLDAEPVASMAEAEGRTVVLREADARGLDATFRSAWITLRAHTALHAVGVLARVTGALAGRGIAVNPVAGFHHDHLFVPVERAGEAMDVLRGLAVRRSAEDGIDTDPGRIDRDVVWEYLSTEAYWGRWRTRADVERQLDSAWRVVGAYRGGRMVGFARGVSDGVSFGYLADVFVLAAARGAGLGKDLVAAMLDGPPHVRWVLFTDDAHTLYAPFGFTPPDRTCLVRPAPAG